MKNTDASDERHGAEQLALLTVPASPAHDLKPSSAHARFRLSKSTRVRGLAHVAEIRRQLADSQAKRDAEHEAARSPRRPHAA